MTTFTQFGNSPGDCRDSNGYYYDRFRFGSISLDGCKNDCLTCEGQYASSLDLKGLSFDKQFYICSCYFEDGAADVEKCNGSSYDTSYDGTGEIASIKELDDWPQTYCYTTGTPPTETESVSHLLLCLPLY